MPSAIKRLEEVEVTTMDRSLVGTYNAAFQGERIFIYDRNIDIKEGYYIRRKSGGMTYCISSEPFFDGDAIDPHYQADVTSIAMVLGLVE